MPCSSETLQPIPAGARLPRSGNVTAKFGTASALNGPTRSEMRLHDRTAV
jgi:hypothetical protein